MLAVRDNRESHTSQQATTSLHRLDGPLPVVVAERRLLGARRIVGGGLAKIQWDTDPSYKARAQKAVPLGVLQTPESVADAFLFLCSPAADYMTGSVLVVDGGCSLYPMD